MLSYSPHLPDGHWPLVSLYDTLSQYFELTKYSKYCKKCDDYVRINGPRQFFATLDSDTKFSEFWTVIQQYPENKDYFLFLTNEAEYLDFRWIFHEYYKYIKGWTLEELSEEERTTLEEEFDSVRLVAYQVALEGEALRLNCDVSEVRPVCPVLPQITDNDEESLLVKLPDDILGRIFPNLDALDIFRMTLVCRKWRSLVYANSKHLNKAEHAVTTHLTTFTDWIDPAKTPPCATFLRNYQSFNWSLMRWYCGISTNLETLIVDHPIDYNYLAMLLQSCPQLKHLRIANDSAPCVRSCEFSPATVHLRELTVFLYSLSSSRHFGQCMDSPRHLHRDVLISSENLQVYRGELDEEDVFLIEAQKPVSNVFSNLIALDRKVVTSSALESVAQIDNLQLRYLKLDELEYSLDDNLEWNGLVDERRARNAMHKLLSKLNHLEVLITSSYIGITNETIQLLVDSKLSLSFAVLFHASFPPQSEVDEWDFSYELDPLQPDVFETFESMLTLNNPEIDLAEIQFVLHKGETLDSLKPIDRGFTVLKWIYEIDKPGPNAELNDRQMQRRLGIEL